MNTIDERVRINLCVEDTFPLPVKENCYQLSGTPPHYFLIEKC